MPEYRFDVGNEERHQVEVRLSSFTGHEEILVDGKPISSKHSFALKGRSEFEVGQKEKHTVIVEVAAGLLGHKVKAYVDGRVVLES